MSAGNLTKQSSDIEKILRAYADIAPRLARLLKHRGAGLDEALHYLVAMHSSLTELRLSLPQLDVPQLARIDATLHNLAATILDLQEFRRADALA